MIDFAVVKVAGAVLALPIIIGLVVALAGE